MNQYPQGGVNMLRYGGVNMLRYRGVNMLRNLQPLEAVVSYVRNDVVKTSGIFTEQTKNLSILQCDALNHIEIVHAKNYIQRSGHGLRR